MGMALLVGIGITMSALVIQGVAGGLGVAAMSALVARRAVGTHLFGNSLTTPMVILVLLAGHMAQINLWALAFVAIGEFGEFAVAFYHSAVNYATLGYGDIVMSPRWRLLGPLQAINGTLAFGWSTAVIVTVVTRLTRYRHHAQVRRGHSLSDRRE
jgi:hypothetical protein